MSLIIELNNLIRERGHISYEEMESECKRLGYRTETGRRRLEPDESPCVKRILKKGARVEYTEGYEYICGKVEPKVELKPVNKLFEIRKNYWAV